MARAIVEGEVRQGHRNRHAQVGVRAPDGSIVGVDMGLSLLLPLLWELGIRTRYSCQGGESAYEGDDEATRREAELAYVMFDDRASFELFKTLDAHVNWQEDISRPSRKSGTHYAIRFEPRDVPTLERAARSALEERDALDAVLADLAEPPQQQAA